MQNSVAPDLAVCLAASTRLGMSSQALRTGEANSPDWEQKWQSSGQPPVFRLMMPSTSTSGPHQRIRTSWASASSSSSRSSGSCSTCSTCSLTQSLTALKHLLPSLRQNVCVVRVVGVGHRSSRRLSHQVLPCIFVGTHPPHGHGALNSTGFNVGQRCAHAQTRSGRVARENDDRQLIGYSARLVPSQRRKPEK